MLCSESRTFRVKPGSSAVRTGRREITHLERSVFPSVCIEPQVTRQQQLPVKSPEGAGRTGLTGASGERAPASSPALLMLGDYLARWLDQSLCLPNVPFGTVGMISQWKIQCLHSWEPCGKMQSCLWISVQFSHSVVSDSLRPHELQHARPPCPSPTPGVHSDSRPSSQ